MTRLLFIAVVYNDVDLTRDLCLSLANQDSGNHIISLVLVDNSDDNDIQVQIDRMGQEFPVVSILRPPKNIGYFPAISAALSKFGRGFDFVIVGNNDLKYAKDFSVKLCSAAYSEDVMVICPDVVTANEVHQNPHHKHRLSRLEKLYFDIYFTHYSLAELVTKLRKFLSQYKFLSNHSTLSIRGNSNPQEIDQGVGAVYVLRPNFLNLIGFSLYYPGFLYGEEACLSWQVRSLNGKTWYDPSLKVWHAESAALGRLPTLKTYSFGRQSYWMIRDKL